MIDHVVAVSCGIYAGKPLLDLDYAEDSEAGTDGNFILTGRGRLIEVQMSAEGATFSRDEMGKLLDLAEVGRRGACCGAEGGVGDEAVCGQRACWWPRTTRASWTKCGRCFAPLGIDLRRRRRTGSAGAGRNREHFYRQRADQGACRGTGHRAFRRLPTIAASRLMRLVARPASIPPTGPKPRAGAISCRR